jgi:phosphoribosyl 1,2-cyclic phosphate phosphodiesterase
MRLTYLGTAAAEGFPALFCRCAYCREAARLGGKNIRTRSQALVDDELLIDFPADTYAHFLRNGIEGDSIRYLLITHAHSDHLYPADLTIRGGAYAHDMRAPTLQVFCSEKTAERIPTSLRNVEVTVLTPFEQVRMGNYTVTPLPARHMAGGEPLIYLIQGDKTLLYAHDTGYFLEEVFDYLQREGVRLDMISLDCTNVDIPISDEGSHMGFPNISRVLERLRDSGAVTEQTVKYVNHFSHNGNPLHHVLEERAASLGCSVSFDGCRVEF